LEGLQVHPGGAQANPVGPQAADLVGGHVKRLVLAPGAGQHALYHGHVALFGLSFALDKHHRLLDIVFAYETRALRHLGYEVPDAGHRVALVVTHRLPYYFGKIKHGCPRTPYTLLILYTVPLSLGITEEL